MLREDAPSCVAPGPSCLAPGVDACALPVSVAAVCDLRTRAYSCPAGATPCPPPIVDLVERCLLARIDAGGATTYWAGDRWAPTWDGERTGFDAGPWISAVTELDGAYIALTVIGFGSELRAARTGDFVDRWGAATNVARCALPSGDADAFCAGPVVHEELRDPLRRGVLPVTYGIGTTAPDRDARRAAQPRDYWTRLAFVDVR